MYDRPWVPTRAHQAAHYAIYTYTTDLYIIYITNGSMHYITQAAVTDVVLCSVERTREALHLGT